MLFGVVAAEILVTYARLPADELYHVSGSGLEGGASRALVFSNYPLALVAIAILAIAADRLPRLRPVALAGAALCAVVFVPGVVDQADLDAKWINAAPAAGVAVALVLTAQALGRCGPGVHRLLRGDAARLALTAFLATGAVPWLAADLGLSFDGVPVLGSLWQTGELRTQPGHPVPAPAVHHGHHHGMDGVLLALAALALSRVRVRSPRGALAAYLSLMLAYGLANASQDFWLEQVVKRGWTTWEIPGLIRPDVSWGWAAILAAAAALRVTALRPRA